jgi:hypothetical protein
MLYLDCSILPNFESLLALLPAHFSWTETPNLVLA